ncbi:hypothetical protein EON81_16460 [bacterium]|nr:MAG: hypothetical protein EON81_16460 [bacterium]
MIEESVRTCRAAAKDIYWKEKNLSQARELMEVAIALAATEGLTSEQKAMNFDLASFCWPGWDEAGIVVKEDDLAAGEHAANENMRLAIELQRRAGPMVNAWFIIGAYHLVRKRWDEAIEAFMKQEAFAREVGEPDGILLAQGYRELSRGRKGDGSDLEAVLAELESAPGENAAEFALQLRVADRVFAGL